MTDILVIDRNNDITLKPIVNVKLKFKGISWEIKLVQHEDYLTKFGEGSAGCTLKHDKEIYLSLKYFGMPLIKHEVLHAYSSSCCIDSCTDLDAADMEEIMAEIVSYHDTDMAKDCIIIHNKMAKKLNKMYGN